MEIVCHIFYLWLLLDSSLCVPLNSAEYREKHWKTVNNIKRRKREKKALSLRRWANPWRHGCFPIERVNTQRRHYMGTQKRDDENLKTREGKSDNCDDFRAGSCSLPFNFIHYADCRIAVCWVYLIINEIVSTPGTVNHQFSGHSSSLIFHAAGACLRKVYIIIVGALMENCIGSSTTCQQKVDNESIHFFLNFLFRFLHPTGADGDYAWRTNVIMNAWIVRGCNSIVNHGRTRFLYHHYRHDWMWPEWMNLPSFVKIEWAARRRGNCK